MSVLLRSLMRPEAIVGSVSGPLLKNVRINFSQPELGEKGADEPQSVSPNPALRGLVSDLAREKPPLPHKQRPLPPPPFQSLPFPPARYSHSIPPPLPPWLWH